MAKGIDGRSIDARDAAMANRPRLTAQHFNTGGGCSGWTCSLGNAWDATGGSAVSFVKDKVTDPHFLVDAATGLGVATAFIACGVTVVCGIGAVAAGTAIGGAAHLGVNAVTPGRDGDYGVYQAFAHSGVSSVFSAVCVTALTVGCLKAAAGGSPHGGLGSFGAGSVLTFGLLTKGIVDDTQALMGR